MPLLPLEPFVHPPELLASEAESTQVAAPPLLHWWVMHTRPRTEKALARLLLGRSVGFFLPQYEKQRLIRGRRQCSHLPLFPGYLFVFGDHDARRTALETNLIINCLPVPDQRGLRDDLSRVYRLMTSDSPLSPEVQLEPGDPVEIIEGSLTGLRGACCVAARTGSSPSRSSSSIKASRSRSSAG